MLNYTVTGKGPACILIHGWGMHHALWLPLVSILSRSHTVYYFDLPGYGVNADFQDLTLKHILEQIALTFPFPAIYVGWSMGGLIATAYADQYPERVNELILVASSPKFQATETWPGLRTAVLEKFQQQLIADHAATLNRFLLLQLHGVSDLKSTLTTLKAVVPDNPPSATVLASGLTLLRDTDLRSQLMTLSMPIKWIFGKLDAIVPVSVVPALQSLAPHHYYEIIPKASHMPFYSHPETVAALIEMSS